MQNANKLSVRYKTINICLMRIHYKHASITYKQTSIT